MVLDRGPQFAAELTKELNRVLDIETKLSTAFYSQTDGQTELLQTQALRVGQVKEPCIGLTQENSIESSVQDSLPYIPWTHGPC